MAENDMSGRGKGRPRLGEVGEIDRTIREAAMQVMREHGEAATVNAVAVKAGLSRKTVYARYPTKSALFVAVIGDILDKAEPVAFQAAPTFEESLCNYVHAALQLIATSGAQAIQRLIIFNPEYMKTLRLQMRRAMETIFAVPLASLLQKAEEEGSIIVADRSFTVGAVLKLILLQETPLDGDRTRRDDEATMQREARLLTALICRGLLPRAQF